MKHLLIPALIFLSSYVFAQTTENNIEKIKKIEVTGSAEMKVVPDELYVSITLQEYYDKQKVKHDIDEIQRSFLDKCAKAGIQKDRIEVQGMSGFDQNRWYWRKRKKEQPDLLASTTYIIKFSNPAEIDKLVNVLDDNATQNMQVTRTTHSNMEAFRKDIKIKALQNAKAKAQYLCESIGEKVGGAVFIREVESGPIMPMYKNMMANSMMDAAESSANEGIDYQKITIRYEMQVQFAIQ